MTGSESNRPIVLAHRGASAHAADNSIEAFELAVAHGADGVEMDVRYSADGVVLLNHDPDVGEMGPLIHHDFAAIRLAHPELPTLDEALCVLGDLIVNVEIKNSPIDADFDAAHRMAEDIVRWVNRHDIHGRVVVTSFNPETVARVGALDPSIETGQLLHVGFPIVSELGTIAAAGHRWVAPNIADVMSDPDAIIGAAHSTGLRIVTWTVDDPEMIRTVSAAGIDGIICNDPRSAMAVIDGGSVSDRGTRPQ